MSARRGFRRLSSDPEHVTLPSIDSYGTSADIGASAIAAAAGISNRRKHTLAACSTLATVPAGPVGWESAAVQTINPNGVAIPSDLPKELSDSKTGKAYTMVTLSCKPLLRWARVGALPNSSASARPIFDCVIWERSAASRSNCLDCWRRELRRNLRNL